MILYRLSAAKKCVIALQRLTHCGTESEFDDYFSIFEDFLSDEAGLFIYKIILSLEYLLNFKFLSERIL